MRITTPCRSGCRRCHRRKTAAEAGNAIWTPRPAGCRWRNQPTHGWRQAQPRLWALGHWRCSRGYRLLLEMPPPGFGSAHAPLIHAEVVSHFVPQGLADDARQFAFAAGEALDGAAINRDAIGKNHAV